MVEKPLQDVSDVPLTEDILAEKPKFIFGYYEWLSRQAQQIVVNGIQGGAGSNVFFTVPKGQKLYIVGLWLSCRHGNAGTGATAFIELSRGGNILGVQLVGSTTLLTQGSNSISFPIPFLLEEGETISVESSIGISAFAGMIGFTIRKDIDFVL